ncbi:protein phosphatase PPM8, putative [Plasmodium sp. DRC-Itaito]|uniref:Protein phosphatase PPM8, putative n=1 Tax=Plasmodium gaboni TaxID=647221 RepID=A0ABY1UPH8_9APIC|nr:protein phosphatase PPM8, putative [Plasmodium gaboni]SOV23427.1 protein phosphatase PPM8, putative [Plasmodium sp. DRC-Itaito]
MSYNKLCMLLGIIRNNICKNNKNLFYGMLCKYPHMYEGRKKEIHTTISKGDKMNMHINVFNNIYKILLGKKLANKKFILLLAFSILAITIDVRYASCNETEYIERSENYFAKNNPYENITIEDHPLGNSDEEDSDDNNYEIQYENLDELSSSYFLRNEHRFSMAQFAANSPIEDRCFISNINIEIDNIEPQNETNVLMNNFIEEFIERIQLKIKYVRRYDIDMKNYYNGYHYLGGYNHMKQINKKTEFKDITENTNTNNIDSNNEIKNIKVHNDQNNSEGNNISYVDQNMGEQDISKEENNDNAVVRAKTYNFNNGETSNDVQNNMSNTSLRHNSNYGFKDEAHRLSYEDSNRIYEERLTGSKFYSLNDNEYKNFQTSNPNFLFAAVIDGHAGGTIADVARKSLGYYLKKELIERRINSKHGKGRERAIVSALKSAHLNLDNDLLNQSRDYFLNGTPKYARTGACSLSVLIDERNYYISNIGDSVGLLIKKHFYFPLNSIHNASEFKEKRKLLEEHPNEEDILVCKICTRDFKVNNDAYEFCKTPFHLLSHHYDNCYVKGRLQPTRSFGDFHLKNKMFAYSVDRTRLFVSEPHSFPYISAEPDIRVLKKHPDDQFIVLMSDGVYEYLNHAQVINVIKTHGSSPERAAKELINTVLEAAANSNGFTMKQLLSLDPSIKRNFYDDVSVVVIKLK